MQSDMKADLPASNKIATYTIRNNTFCVPRTYELKDVAGRGAFGTVARFVHNATTYAFKKLDKDVHVTGAARLEPLVLQFVTLGRCHLDEWPGQIREDEW